MTTTENPQDLAVSDREMDPNVASAQIGRMNIFAISGGRRRLVAGGLELPVSSGYSVRVTLAANDTYTVQRVMRRGAKVWVKGTCTDVYCDDLGEVCYKAGMYKSYGFGNDDMRAL